MITSRRLGSPRWLTVAGAIALAISINPVSHAESAPAPAGSAVPSRAIPTGQKTAAPAEFAQVISRDPYTNPDSQHATEVEADTISVGNLLLATFQVGRNQSGGAANIGWAASGDGGATWGHSFLPGITDKAGGPWAAASDPVAATNDKFRVWLISSLALDANRTGVAVYTSRAPDGQDFGLPIQTLGDGVDWDKNWITCDNNRGSPFWGNCYTVANVSGAGEIFTSVSTDGGLTWSGRRSTPDHARGVGVQPIVLPNGQLWVVYLDFHSSQIRLFRSLDGGVTFTPSQLISDRQFHVRNTGSEVTNVRDGLGVPSVEVDGGGMVYITWPDCRFQAGCAANDIVLSRWSLQANEASAVSAAAPVRIPGPANVTAAAAPPGNSIIPGVCADRGTSGATARVALYFYWVSEDFIYLVRTHSTNGGTSWSPAELIDGSSVVLLPKTSQGRMAGDYLSCSVVDGANAVTAYAIGEIPSGTEYNVPMNGYRQVIG